MTKQDFVREFINYKMMYFDNLPVDKQSIDDIEDDSDPKEESWFDEEGDRQDTP